LCHKSLLSSKFYCPVNPKCTPCSYNDVVSIVYYDMRKYADLWKKNIIVGTQRWYHLNLAANNFKL
jgi:hypothetical protein